ncbi:MAG TPA: hypothetical protein VI758_10840 [Bacteroidota bacterium]
MKRFTAGILVLLLGSASSRAQGVPSQFAIDEQTLANAQSARLDSLPPTVVRRLLPENISFMEKTVWGENGFLRSAGIAAPLTPEVRKSELGIRRAMLSTHQIGGFVTLASMLAAVYYGQKSLNDPNSGTHLDPYRSKHQLFVTTTIVTYSATGLLAILAPPPMIRRNEFSTTTLHKTLAWVHVIGMIVTPILGGTVLKRGPIGRYLDINQARYHQISAYATTAVFMASMITVTF